MCKTPLAVTLTLLLVVSLTACAPRVIQTPVDPRLTRDCAYPVREGDSNSDIADAYLRRGAALEECTARMRAIRGN